MKKLFCVLVLCILTCMLLLGCSGGSTVSPAWADEETLVYVITDTETEEIKGSMTVQNIRSPEDKTLGGKEYNADCKTIITISTDVTTTVTFLTKQYKVLAEEKTVVGGDNDYVLNSYHSGKYAYYSINGGKEQKINVGTTGYTEGEYLYNYIRCYALPTVPTSIKIADYQNGRAITVEATALATEELSVPYPDNNKTVNCTVIEVSLSDTPKGNSIYCWFTPDDKSNILVGKSISESKKFPVKMVENNLTYTLVAMTVK